MSDISDIRTGIMGKLTAASADYALDVVVDRWAGEEKAINMKAVPAFLVQWAGRGIGESMEIGAATYMSDPVFVVVVVADDVKDGDYGDDICAELLELGASALNEQSVSIGGVADAGIIRPYRGQFEDQLTESLRKVHAGRYIYAQAWQVERLVA